MDEINEELSLWIINETLHDFGPKFIREIFSNARASEPSFWMGTTFLVERIFGRFLEVCLRSSKILPT
jgi:hypothetical protein